MKQFIKYNNCIILYDLNILNAKETNVNRNFKSLTKELSK